MTTTSPRVLALSNDNHCASGDHAGVRISPAVTRVICTGAPTTRRSRRFSKRSAGFETPAAQEVTRQVLKELFDVGR
jgi:hypothetical protein